MALAPEDELATFGEAYPDTPTLFPGFNEKLADLAAARQGLDLPSRNPPLPGEPPPAAIPSGPAAPPAGPPLPETPPWTMRAEDMGPPSPGAPAPPPGMQIPRRPGLAPGRHAGHENLNRALAFDRALEGPERQLIERQGEYQRGVAGAQKTAAESEDTAGKQFEERRIRENEQYAQERDARNTEIRRYIDDKANAEANLAGGFWGDKGTADKVMAAIMIAVGGFGAALQNRGAGRLGQVGNAQNQGMKSLERIMEEDYRNKMNKVKGASDAILQARYGLQSAADNHRAAINDLDAEAAARYQSIANTMKMELARRGMDKAAIDQDAAVLAMLDKRDQHEQQIFQKQDELDVTERGQNMHVLAAQAMAGARGKAAQDQYDKEVRGRSAAAQKALPEEFDKDLAIAGIADRKGGNKSGMLLAQNKEYQRLLHALDTNNPLEAKSALMELDSLKRGGPATDKSMQAYNAALGGAKTQLDSWIEKGRTGNISPEAKQIVRDAVGSGMDVNIAQAGVGHDQMATKYYSASYGPLKPDVENNMAIFEQFRDRNNKQPFHLKRDPNARGIDRLTGEITPSTMELALQNPDMRAMLQWLQNNQGDPRAQGVRDTLERNGIDVQTAPQIRGVSPIPKRKKPD